MAVVGIPLIFMLQLSIMPIWISLVTVQLIAHMVLMNSMLPPEVVLFLREILYVLRLFPSTEASSANDGSETLNGTFE